MIGVFVSNYFDFWRTYISLLLPMGTLQIVRVVHYDLHGDLSQIVRRTLLNFFGVLPFLIIADYGVKLIGLLVVNNYILRKSNQQLLNNIKTGVMIVSEDSNRLQFANKAAKNITQNLIKVREKDQNENTSMHKHERLSED